MIRRIAVSILTAVSAGAYVLADIIDSAANVAEYLTPVVGDE